MSGQTGHTGRSDSAQTRKLTGTLAKTPIARLLMSASNARVTGTLELSSTLPGLPPDATRLPPDETRGEAETASIVMARGFVTKVKTSAPVAYLGAVLYELGYIDTDVLNDSLHELSRMKWLHGEILLTRGAITHAQLVEGLHEQTSRKLVYLFTLPGTTTYTFDAEVDRLASWGGSDWPHVDPTIAVWRGVREGFAQEDIDAAFLRQTQNAFRLAATAEPKKLDMTDSDRAAIECLRGRALTLEELAAKAEIDPRRAREIIYFLVVTKQAEVLDTSGIRPAFRPPTPAGGTAKPRAAEAPNTRPTVPEMPAVGSSPKIAMPTGRQQTESAQWRAMAPPMGYSSAKIAVSERTLESGRVPAAGKPPGGTPSSAWFPSSSPSSVPPKGSANSPSPVPASGPASISRMPAAARMTMTTPASAWMPPNIPSSVPPRITTMGSSESSQSLKRATPVQSMPSGQFNARLAVEFAARRKVISERARAVLKEDHFQRLGLARDATQAQVEQAFAALKALWDIDLLPPALDDAKADSAFVMQCMVEAFAVLRDARRRQNYLLELSAAALRAPADQIQADLATSGATDPYEGAKTCFGRGDLERAERLARRAVKIQPEAARPLALLAWIEATKPANASPEETKRCIVMLDRAIRADENLDQAFYWRGLLHKRIESHAAAVSNLRKAVQINPKHIEAVRELRVYEMRIRRNSITMKGVK